MRIILVLIRPVVTSMLIRAKRYNDLLRYLLLLLTRPARRLNMERRRLVSLLLRTLLSTLLRKEPTMWTTLWLTLPVSIPMLWMILWTVVQTVFAKESHQEVPSLIGTKLQVVKVKEENEYITLFTAILEAKRFSSNVLMYFIYRYNTKTCRINKI